MVKRISLLVVCLFISTQSWGAEWGKYLYEALTSSDTNKIRIYPASDQEFTVIDERYSGKISTHTAGKLIASDDIPTTAFQVTGFSFYAIGGDVSVNGLGGTIYILEDSALNETFEIGFSTPTLTATLPASTTLYYTVKGLR